MNTPRIEVHLNKIRHNAQTVVGRLKTRGISVTGVTKAVCGHPTIAQAMLDGGVLALAEARLSNVRKLRKAGITCSITLIRTPMLSQIDQVIQFCEASYNTEMPVIAALAAAASRKDTVHGIILMVEMGDLREGIMPRDLGAIAQQVVDLPGVALKGIGANYACLSGTAPNAAEMEALSDLANDTEAQCGPFFQTVSGGNSANLPWAFAENPTGRINDLRLGEAILLGVDPVSGLQIGGMYTDAFTLVAEVIESGSKPFPLPHSICDPVFKRLHLVPKSGQSERMILAIGHQDTDVLGLSIPPGKRLLGATSDHLVIGTCEPAQKVGSEMRFQMNYSALMSAMSAPDVRTKLLCGNPSPRARASQGPSNHLVPT
ncbi:alanine/ornithine racemase family PLP-dependent enzyme [Phaeobacter sp. NW0010-22]|jgi:ornithine racemase|uniref:alanine/ornithine racemase family PLP-dependent enzyme n=1 Tax=Phaeobacter sp. NW0010-22 TaxID=3135907 RepID=UPI003105CB98